MLKKGIPMLKNDHVVLFMLTELRQNNNSISFMTEAFTSHISLMQ